MHLRRVPILSLIAWAILPVVLLWGFHAAIAQSSAPSAATGPVRVVTRVIPPFVIEQGGELDGFSIELWNQIAETLQRPFEIKVVKNVAAILNTVQTKAADLGIAAISITSERERKLDFSQPIFDSGLQILVKSQGSKTPMANLGGLFSPALLQLLGLMLLIVLIPAHLVWWVERRHHRNQQPSFLDNSAYFPGIFKAVWWAAATLATQAEEMPKAPLGRLLAVVWMFVSVVFVAYFTATVTTSLTVEQLQSNIKGPQDLPGRRVATVTGSTSASYLQKYNIRATGFLQIEQAFAALAQNQADAVVYDAPILLYYAAHEGKGQVEVVGSIFKKESYGIALPNGSPLRKEINRALLALQENGTYDEIYERWFK
jgi:polar amino acid transport system substrate-binding protein